MAFTSYCKKCRKDYPVSETCPECGSKLGKNSVRVAWCVDHKPVCDWICWNHVMRIFLPVALITFLLVIFMQFAFGGLHSIGNLLTNGFVVSYLYCFAAAIALIFLLFLLQGADIQDCIVDSKGIHVHTYLPMPTPWKAFLRFKRLKSDTIDGIVQVSTSEILWKDITRVQLWPEKGMILFYSPSWLLKTALPCTAFHYEDSMCMIAEKLGKKKKVILPSEVLLYSAMRTSQENTVHTLDDMIPETWQNDVDDVHEANL